MGNRVASKINTVDPGMITNAFMQLWKLNPELHTLVVVNGMSMARSVWQRLLKPSGSPALNSNANYDDGEFLSVHCQKKMSGGKFRQLPHIQKNIRTEDDDDGLTQIAHWRLRF